MLPVINDHLKVKLIGKRGSVFFIISGGIPIQYSFEVKIGEGSNSVEAIFFA
jgi:hypothetical protein